MKTARKHGVKFSRAGKGLMGAWRMRGRTGRRDCAGQQSSPVLTGMKSFA